MNARLQSLGFAFGTALALASLSACGGGGGSAPSGSLPSTGNTGTAAPQGTANAAITLSLQQYSPLSTAAVKRRAAFVSPATAQISLTVVSVNGAAVSGSPTTFPVSPSSPGCAGASGVVTCTLNANIPIGSDVLQASTLDANGHSLGSSTITATITQNATNAIALAIGGQIASLQMYLSRSSFSSGTAATSNVIVVPLDQSGAEIVNPGNYNPSIAVTSSNSVSGHVSLITDGTNTGQSATIVSPNDQIVVNYDGVATSGSSTITANAGGGITASRTVSVSSPGLSASPSGAQFVSSSSYVFTTAGQTGTITVSGGTAPYTVVSSDTGVATISGTGPYTVTAQGYGAAGTSTITVTDSASAHTTIPVTFLAPSVLLTPSTCGGTSCTSSSVSYTVPIGGPTSALAPTIITAGGGTGTYGYFFISTGTTTSQYATVAQAGSTFTITPSGFGNDAIIVTSGNQTGYYAINASANAFGATLPTAIGMLYESSGAGAKFYSATLPNAVTGVTPSPLISGFIFNAGSPPTISATPTAPGNGTMAFSSGFGTPTSIPYTVFGLSFASYEGGGFTQTGETATPADEAFTAPGESEILTVSGLTANFNLSAQSANSNVVTASAAANHVTVTAVNAGTTTVLLTDTGNGATVTYTVSVTQTLIPVTNVTRQR
jgi:large repetitive protein